MRIFLWFVVFLAAGAAFAGELSLPGLAEFAAVAEDAVPAGWVWVVLGSPAALALIAWLGQKFVKRSRGKWYEVAAQALELGVRTTYEEYVRNIKIATDGGRRKLSKGERKMAVTMALGVAQDYLKAHGTTLLKYYAKEYLPVLVDRTVKEMKGKGAPLA